MHDAFVGELKNGFSAALGKDRLYNRPCGFLNDQQIWMVGVTIQYMVGSVLHFDHADFLRALRLDLGPILGDVGQWCLKSLEDQAKENGNKDLKKQFATCLELVEKYMENQFDTLGQEKKYLFINKFSPKKLPDQQVRRENLPHIYSWMHYAPIEWYHQQRR